MRKKHFQPRRRFVVFTSLVAVLTFTSMLLLALAPAPLKPDASSSLYAIDAPPSLDVIFQTRAPQRAWKYIYVHHSGTLGGNALTVSQATGGLGDHFVIGNGDGAVDGELQIGQRWDSQQAARLPGTSIDPACISICLIGDFDQTRPTPTQLRRLAQLISTLQARYRIAGDHVTMIEAQQLPRTSQVASVAVIGRYFPTRSLREQLLP